MSGKNNGGTCTRCPKFANLFGEKALILFVLKAFGAGDTGMALVPVVFTTVLAWVVLGHVLLTPT